MADKYTLLGCYIDDKVNRTLPVQPLPAYRTNCAQVCHDFCNTPVLQAMFFGLEYGTECWCGTKGNHDNSSFRLAASPDECNYKCPADPTESCGGDFRLNLYSILDPTPVDLPTSPPGVPPPGASSPSSTVPGGSDGGASPTGTPGAPVQGSQDSGGGGSQSLSKGQIAGIIVSTFVIVGLAAALLIWLMRRRKQRGGGSGRRLARTGAADPSSASGAGGAQMAGAGGAAAGAAGGNSSNNSREGRGGSAGVGGSSSNKAIAGHHREGEGGGAGRGATASVDGESLVAGAPYHHQHHHDELPGYQSAAR